MIADVMNNIDKTANLKLMIGALGLSSGVGNSNL